MNSPWGVVWTPRDFGEYGNSILVGNFGSGKIAAFNGFTGKFIALLKNPDNTDMIIDGLWMIAFGNNANAGPSTTLFFTAGIQAESHGHFGTITPVDGMDGNEDKLTFFSNYNIILHSAVETGEFAAEFPFDFNDIVSLRLIPGRIG